MKIGITDCGEKYPIYEKWILGQATLENPIIPVKLGYQQNNLKDVEQCEGIVLTGGEDIHPRFYNHLKFLSLCNPNFMNERRDEFEWLVCDYIFKNKIPVLGICRGLQLVNVFLGGTLIPDIPTQIKAEHSKFYEGKDRYHEVKLSTDSLLSQIVGQQKGEVNSAHHQSAQVLGENLAVNALSPDGIIEGLEWENFEPLVSKQHYLMLVQWHPERIINAEQNSFSYKIRQHFVENIQSKIQ